MKKSVVKKPLRHKNGRGVRSEILPELNRSELARSIGKNRSWLTRILQGKVNPKLDTLIELAEGLGLTLDQTEQLLTTLKREYEKER